MSKLKALKVMATVQAKHQRGKFWAEQSIRDDAARLQGEFGVPVKVHTERGGLFSSRADGRIEFVLPRSRAGMVEDGFEEALRGSKGNPELWMHWFIDGAVVDVDA